MRFPVGQMLCRKMNDRLVPVQCDLHLLSDGQIIVLHDDTLRRTAGAGAANAPFPEALLDTPVEELAYADLKDVDVGAGCPKARASRERPADEGGEGGRAGISQGGNGAATRQQIDTGKPGAAVPHLHII